MKKQDATKPVLTVLTLNMGYNVMANRVAGTEALMVKQCQRTYSSTGGMSKDGQLSQCTSNGVKLLVNYDLIGLQEVNLNFLKPFFEEVEKEGARLGKKFKFVRHANDFSVITIYDENKLGKGMLGSPADFLVGDHTWKNKDRRPMQIVYFPTVKLLFANLHAPHKINLKLSIEDAFERAKPFLASMGLVRQSINLFIVTGDFNDDKKEVVVPSFEISAYGKKLKIPSGSKAPTTCCTDSNYRFPGDYILMNSDDTRGWLRVSDYGYPPGYSRSETPISDHDPLIMVLNRVV